MKPLKAFLLFLIVLQVAGCSHYAYYQSPLHTNTSSYKTIPLQSDSIAVATYASGAYTTGGANERWHDPVNGFIGSLYRAHNFKNFQLYYGAGGSLGNYQVRSYGPRTNDINKNINESLINSLSGNKFFGSWGVEGGFSFVKPLGREEWRFIQVAFNWQHEFGEYLDFRQQLPDTAANLVGRDPGYFTVFFGTEFAGTVKNGSIGYKGGFVFTTRRLNLYDIDRNRSNITPAYMSHTLQLTRGRVTGFFQLNLGTYAAGSLLGVNVRMSR